MTFKNFILIFLAVFALGLVFFFIDLSAWKQKVQNSQSDDVNQHKLDILNDLEHAPIVDLSSVKKNEKLTEIQTHPKCNAFDCFDIYRCGTNAKKILVHIPKPKRFIDSQSNNVEVAPFTRDFVEILEAIADTEFYTADPSKACVTIPAINVLSEGDLSDAQLASEALQLSSSAWKESEGQNHLLFSF